MYHRTMIIRKAFKFRLEPNQVIVEAMAQVAGSARFVWNKALALQKERLDQGLNVLSYVEIAAQLTKWRNAEDTGFLARTSSTSQQQKLKDLDRAIKDAFNKSSPKKFPVFKKKADGADSFRIVAPQFKTKGSKIFLPKIGWVCFRKSREIVGTFRNATVTQQGDHWFVSIQTEQEVAEPVHPSTAMVGIDVGVARFATLSDGQVIEPLNSFKKLEKKLAKAQRRLAKKKKFSSNWKKQKKKINKIYTAIANARNDFLHKTSTRIANENQVVVIEDLKVANMSRSAKGTKVEPGRNVAAKSGLNKSILDQGWGNFRLILDYKLAWLGGMLIPVNPRNTSRTCGQCGHVAADNRQSQAVFKCVRCGHAANADLNAAVNILAAGQAVLACGEAA